ncbi:MAG: hypothetical protein HQ517_09470 [SAR324 cluster bacterium]|nr:hypothetical protein [SAR324 cluster bacterium]
MGADTRIKEFLKTQINKGNITKNDLLKLEPDHLMKITQLKDINRETITETLQAIKFKVNPELIKNDIQRLFQKQKNPLADQINGIMND